MTPTATITCPSCGAPAEAGDAFCEACGSELPAVAAAAVEPRASTPAAGGDGSRSSVRAPCVSCGAAADQISDGYCNQCGMKQPSPRDHIEIAPADGVAAVTDRGHRHPRNEDAVAVTVTRTGRVLAVVCDGVSTSSDADVASQTAVDAALAELDAAESPWPMEDAHARAFAAARDAVRSLPYRPDGPYGPPACTYLAAAVDNEVTELWTLGDCRAFWLPAAGAPAVLTVDDSWAAEQVRVGTMSVEEAYASPQAHVITRWLGADGDPGWEPHRTTFRAEGPGRLVLCSDGLWNYTLDPARVATEGGTGSAHEIAARLVAFANDQGGHDNISVVVIDMPATRSAPAASGEPEEGATP